MPNPLELPDDLQSLIEKREAERRANAADESAVKECEPSESERRTGGRRESDQQESG